MRTGFIEKAATWMARRPGETAQLARDSRRLTEKHLLFGVALVVLCGVYGPYMAHFLHHWDEFHIQRPLATGAWTVLPVANSEVSCPFDALGGSRCPANPANPALWTSAERREIQTTTSANSRLHYAQRSLNFWIGAVIPPAELGQAALTASTQLILGRITSPYRIWLDGRYYGAGRGWEDTEPIVVHVPLERLREARPLHVAIRVYNVLNSIGAPDRMNFDHGGEGFSSALSEGNFRAMLNFTERVRPLMLLLAYSVMALMFFFFWAPARVKQEYFYLALYAMINAIYEAKQVDLWGFRISHEAGVAIDSLLRFYLCAFALLLGLSFARARRAFFRYGVPLALLAPLPLLPKIYFTTDLYVLVHGLKTWMLPTEYLLGAGVTLLQAVYLQSKKGSGSYLPVRIRRLTLFSVAMGTLGIFYFLFYNQLLPGEVYRFYALTYGFEHFAFLMFFGAIALHEYGEQELRLAKTPVSQYHQRPILPERVAGALLVVDLKNSEELFRRGAKAGDAGKLVDTCISKMWAAVLAHEGIVLQTEGDALRAFFDGDVCERPVGAALAASDAMARALRALEPEFGMALDFRGGIAVGEIRPIWQEVGSNRFASWVEAGNSNPFVDSTRLMDLERKVDARPQETLVVLFETCAVDLDGGIDAKRWHRRHLSLSAKHGVVFETAVYIPEKAGAVPELRQAA